MLRTALVVCAIFAAATDVARATTHFGEILRMKNDLYKHVKTQNYNNAVALAKRMSSDGLGTEISDVVRRLLLAPPNINVYAMSFAYQLWKNDASNIVSNHFPPAFKLIFNGDSVTIRNLGYDQVLKFGYPVNSSGDKLAYGDSRDANSRRFSWEFMAKWKYNAVRFKVRNVDTNFYMMAAGRADGDGDHQMYGSPHHATTRHRFYLRPFYQDGVLCFHILSSKYGQPLKLALQRDGDGDRSLWSSAGTVYNTDNRFKWYISQWNPHLYINV